MTVGITGWSLEGVDLRTFATNIETVNGWDSWPGRRGQAFTVPFVHGEQTPARKFIPGRDIALQLIVLDRDTAGAVTSTPAEHAQDNIDRLLGLMWKRSGLLTLTRTMPDSTIRTMLVEAVDVIPFDETPQPLGRRMLALFRAPNPFWRETAAWSPHTETGIGASRGFDVVTGGNAPIHDTVVRFTATTDTANPRLEWGGTDPEFLAYAGTIPAGRWVEFDCGRRTAVWDDGSRADAGIDYGYPWWLELPPDSTVGFTGTATSGTWDLSITGFDKWF